MYNAYADTERVNCRLLCRPRLILGSEWCFASTAQLVHCLWLLHWKNRQSSAHHKMAPHFWGNEFSSLYVSLWGYVTIFGLMQTLTLALALMLTIILSVTNLTLPLTSADNLCSISAVMWLQFIVKQRLTVLSFNIAACQNLTFPTAVVCIVWMLCCVLHYTGVFMVASCVLPTADR